MEIKLLKQTTSQVNLFFPSNTPVKDKCEKKKEQPNFENALLNSTLENIEAYFRSPDADALLLHNNIKGCCLFARIINNQQGRNQLIKLAIHSPDLKILTANRLSLAINDQGITKTLLAYMCESKERIGLLKFLVNADMKELTEIPASIWLQKPRKQKGKPQESSPFFNCFIDSPELFISLFTQYPDYLKTFPEQAWTETGCTKDRLYQNISILSYLAHAKCDCLNKLLSCNDNYLYKMPLSNILQHTFVAGHYNMSVALALTLDLKGILILGHWLKHNPQLFRDLSHETWFEPHYLDKKLTSYAKLLMMPEGHVFISQLIHDEVIDFANKTSVETFIVPQSKDSRTVLSVLAADIELTVPLLCLYFEKNPGLATAIPASAWTYALENEDPPLHILTKCLTGIDFLSELLIKNPNLAEELPAEAWYRPYKKNPNRCPISQLVLTPHGLRLVLQLLDLNPKRACDFPVNNWVPKNSEDVQDNDITDWVGLMARNESGQELIRQLVCHNHQFITYLPQNVREDLRKFSLAAGYTQNGFFETVPESKQTPKTRQLPKGLGN